MSSTTPTVGVLAIQGDFAQHILVLNEIGNANILEVRDSETLLKCDALIIPGGESTTIGVICNDYNLIQSLKEFVLNPKKYVWGICAGLILLSNKLVNIETLTHLETETDINSKDNNKYLQPLIGGLDVTTHRNYFGSQCNSSLRTIYIMDTNNNGNIIQSQSHFIRAPMIININNQNSINTLAYTYDGTNTNQKKLITCVEDTRLNILGTVFHPEVTYLNNKFDDSSKVDRYWHDYFLSKVYKLNNFNNNLIVNVSKPLSSKNNYINYQNLIANSVKRAFPLMLHGGVIMDVVNSTQARIAEEAGACAVMALERIPADIKKDGGVARMSDPLLIKEIKESVSIPIMAKSRIGHFGEALVLETIGIDCIDESEVLTPADEKYHINKHPFSIPFVCGAKDLGEALRRISEGAAMIRLKGNAGTGNVMEAVRHARLVFSEINRLKSMSEDEIYNYSKEVGASVELVKLVSKMGRLPVTTFAAGGIATPSDVLLMMRLGCDGVFVGSGIFKSSNPSKRARAIVHACTYYNKPEIVCKVSENLGKAMVGVLNKGEKYQFIHYDSKL